MARSSLAQPPVKDAFEHRAWKSGTTVCGIDEVGRGCLAGPLVVCAAIMSPGTTHPFLRDSKKLTEKRRLEMYAWLTERCTYSLAVIDPHTVDTINIYQATLRAMQKACIQLYTAHPHAYASVSHILVDAMPLTLPNLPHPPIDYFPHGESYSSSIAAASIIAKVTRDELVKRLHPSFPAFSFDRHKGYGTKVHRDALAIHGASMMHRMSFLKNILPPAHNVTSPHTTTSPRSTKSSHNSISPHSSTSPRRRGTISKLRPLFSQGRRLLQRRPTQQRQEALQNLSHPLTPSTERQKS